MKTWSPPVPLMLVGCSILMTSALTSCTGPLQARAPSRVDMCELLPKMKPCWEKAGELLTKLQSCGSLASSYAEGVREEVASAGTGNESEAAESAAFVCSGLCALRRHESAISWRAACRTAAAAMNCRYETCPEPTP